MISAVKITHNTQYPSFKGIVKVENVILDGKTVEPIFVNGVNKPLCAAVQRVKDFLMGKPGIVNESVETNYFRYLYGIYDKDYRAISKKSSGSTRNFFDKIRVNNNYYLLSNADANYIAKKGIAIGNTNSTGNPRQEYGKSLLEIKNTYENLTIQPKLTIHTYSDKQGIVRLSGIGIGCDKTPSYSFSFPPIFSKK